MTALLERGHADVVVAESGADALAVLERTPDIDIVLMDIMMPVMDGYDTMRAIRAIDRFAALPIIAVTGKVRPASASAASMPEPTTTSRSRSTPPSSSRRSSRGCHRPRRSPLHDRHDALPSQTPSRRTP